MSKKYIKGTDLHNELSQGIEDLAEYVSATLGPGGRNVLLKSKDRPAVITKDGVTISKFMTVSGHFTSVGAEVVKEVASLTNEAVGDGTTTSIVLAAALYKEAQKYLNSGVRPIHLKRGMEAASKQIVEMLEEQATPIASRDDIEHIASISSNGDKQIAKLIAEAIDKIGKDGAISIEDSRTSKTYLDVVEGFSFASGYASESFITDERKKHIKHEDCLLFVTDRKLDLEEMMPMLELVARDGKPFVIIAEDFEKRFLSALIMNAVRGTMKVVAIKAPKYGEERRNILSDLALSVGAKYVTRESGLKIQDLQLADLGRAKTTEITKDKTTIAGGECDYDLIDNRIEFLKEEIRAEDDIAVCERIQERITSLSAGVAVIRVGAHSQIEMIEKKHRLEDALEAVHAAQSGGIHGGGGIPLYRSATALKPPEDINENELFGFNIVKKASAKPLSVIADNADMSADLVKERVLEIEDNMGYNFATGKVVNLLEEGIVDPVSVTCTALRNAVSVVAALISTNHAIVED
tara:strand:- start:15429 stop:16997 length:1569 start_codon:yes stop_codon:yes gene_type:complete